MWRQNKSWSGVRKGPRQGMKAASKKLKKARGRFSLQGSRRNQPCWTLTWVLWNWSHASGRQNCVIIDLRCLKALSLWELLELQQEASSGNFQGLQQSVLFELGLAGWVGLIRWKGDGGHLTSPWVKVPHPVIYLAFPNQILTSTTLFQLSQSWTQNPHNCPMIKWKAQSSALGLYIQPCSLEAFASTTSWQITPSFLCRISQSYLSACWN